VSGDTDKVSGTVSDGIQLVNNDMKVWLIGEMGGGSKYFSRENAIGLYRELKDQLQKGVAPEYIIFCGDILPKIPEFITKGGTDKMQSLEDQIDTIDNAVVAIKPHLTRIMDFILEQKTGTKVAYVMGQGDEYNIRSGHDLIVKSYNHNPRFLSESAESYGEKAASDEALIKECTKLRDNARGGIESAKSKKEVREQRKFIKHMNERIKENLESSRDYNHLAKRYDRLENLWIEEHPDASIEKISEIFGEGMLEEHVLDRIVKVLGKRGARQVYATLEEEYEKVNEELKGTDKEKEAHKFEELDSKSKSLANKLKKYEFGKMQEVKKVAEQAEHERLKGGEIYTHNLPGSKKLDMEAIEVAREEMLVHIRNAFGRRANIEIKQKNIEEIELGNGVKIRVSNNPTNTSQTYKKSSMSDLKKEVHLGNSEGIKIAVMAHSQDGGVTVEPLFNGSDKVVHVIKVPPFIDPQKHLETWDSKIKTPITETVTKGPVSSGFWEVSFDEKGVDINEVFKTHNYLLNQANREKQEQLQGMAKMLKKLKPVRVNGEIDNKDILQMNNKLPSEMNAELLSKLLLHNGIRPASKVTVPKLAEALKSGNLRHDEKDALSKALDWCTEYVAPGHIENEARALQVLMINDTHIGTAGFGIPTQRLIEGLVKYYEKNEDTNVPLVLFLGGDNLEAKHKGIQNEINNEILLKNVKMFEGFLEEKGVKKESEQFENEINRYKALLLEKRPISNVDEQARVLVDSIEPLVKFASAVIVVSGQHFNKTYPDRSRDEATALAMLIEEIGGKDKTKVVMAVPGGDSGAGSVLVNEHFGLFAAHILPKKIDDMNLQEKVALGADTHVHEVRVSGERVYAIGSSSSVINNFPTERGMSTSQNTRGFTLLGIKIAMNESGEDVIEEVRSKHISLELLISKGYLKEDPDIRAFETGLNSMKMPMQKVKN
jgi:hypothetical protein